jgi:hypothetical protein
MNLVLLILRLLFGRPGTLAGSCRLRFVRMAGRTARGKNWMWNWLRACEEWLKRFFSWPPLPAAGRWAGIRLDGSAGTNSPFSSDRHVTSGPLGRSRYVFSVAPVSDSARVLRLSLASPSRHGPIGIRFGASIWVAVGLWSLSSDIYH